MENTQTNLWHKIHFEDSTLVALHVHPSLKASLFNRALTGRFRASRSFDPFSVRTDLNRLQAGVWMSCFQPFMPPKKGFSTSVKW